MIKQDENDSLSVALGTHDHDRPRAALVQVDLHGGEGDPSLVWANVNRVENLQALAILLADCLDVIDAENPVPDEHICLDQLPSAIAAYGEGANGKTVESLVHEDFEAALGLLIIRSLDKGAQPESVAGAIARATYSMFTSHADGAATRVTLRMREDGLEVETSTAAMTLAD